MGNARNLGSLLNTSSTIQADDLNIGQLGNRNKIINGGFDVWQRGSSFTTTGTFLYFADRWTGFNYNAGSQVDRQEFTVGQTDVANEPTYYIRVTTGGSEYWLAQKIEDVRTFAGQTVTLSWWGRASANTTITARATQVFGSGGSSDVNVATQNFNFTTSWQKFTWTTDIASIAGKTVGSSSFLQMWWQGNLSSAGTTIDFAQVQLEAGDTATPFEHRSYGQELALCQRYFQAHGDVNFQGWNHNIADTGGTRSQAYSFPVQMRAVPTITYQDNVGNAQRIYAEYPNSTSGNNITFNFYATTSSIMGFKYPYGNLYGSNGDSYMISPNDLFLDAEL